MKNPKISVIMPVYNAEKYLDESINSILNQTLKDFEFIIIDDGSKDNSLEIIKKFKKKDKRIKLIENKKNLGVAKTRTRGIKLAKGKYIATFDADDISLRKRLEIQYNFLEKNPDIFLIGGSAIIIDESGKKIGVFKKINNSKKTEKKLLNSNPMVNPSTMFRNKPGIFYRDKFDGADEYDLFLRFLSEGKKITNLQEFLVKYRVNPNSISFRKRAKQEFFSKKIREFYWQRKAYGKDSYDSFDLRIAEGLIENSDFEKIKHRVKILGSFQDNQMKLSRKNIKTYFKKYGFDKNLFFYYILSFFPKNFIEFLREKFV